MTTVADRLYFFSGSADLPPGRGTGRSRSPARIDDLEAIRAALRP